MSLLGLKMKKMQKTELNAKNSKNIKLNFVFLNIVSSTGFFFWAAIGFFSSVATGFFKFLGRDLRVDGPQQY
jgi:hypothetical protein